MKRARILKGETYAQLEGELNEWLTRHGVLTDAPKAHPDIHNIIPLSADDNGNIGILLIYTPITGYGYTEDKWDQLKYKYMEEHR